MKPRRDRSTARDSTLRGVAWISPWIVGFLAFMAVPLALSFYYSLTEYSLLQQPLFIGFDNYRELLGDTLFWTAVRNTVFYAVFAVAIGTLISIGLAVLLNQNVRGARFVLTIVFLPTLVPLVAAALGWMWLYNGEYGLFNRLLAGIGLDPGPNWLGSRAWAMPSLILMSFWSVGGAVVIYLAALRDVPASLYEAADVDGVSAIGRFRHVTLPMISPAILFNVVMAVIWSLQVFAVPYIMTRGGPEHSTYFYTHYLWSNAFAFQRMGYASAMAWIQLLAILLLTGVMFLLSRRFVFYRAA